MTIVAAGSYPHIIEDDYIGESTGIIIMSDSRITNGLGESKDIGTKVFQIMDNIVIACSGNVEFYEETLKSLKFILHNKEKRFNSLIETIDFFTGVINFKRKFVQEKRDYKIVGQFLLAIIDQENTPRLYGYNTELDDDYTGTELFKDESIELIGENFSYQDRLRYEIYSKVESQMKKNNVIEFSDLRIPFKWSLDAYIEKYPNRNTVGGLVQSFSIQPYPLGIVINNFSEADLNLGVASDWISTYFDNESDQWKQKNENGEVIAETYNIVSNKFK